VSGFLGQYEFQLDEKGRVSLPSAFRKGAEEASFVLLQWEPPYLTLFPEEAWERAQERLMEFRKGGPANAAWVRSMTARALEVTPDRQGRILIPSRLQEAASLEGTVLLLGNLNTIEIWNPGLFRAADAAADGAAAANPAFADFAHQIFGQ
jgi:MraZ protein